MRAAQHTHNRAGSDHSRELIPGGIATRLQRRTGHVETIDGSA
jgi:hypothetical protein